VGVRMSVKDIENKRETIEMRCPTCGGRMLIGTTFRKRKECLSI
jgi:DNA-directed RNA polymerase subunit RPC12/RpoP